jgi:dipeptidase
MKNQFLISIYIISILFFTSINIFSQSKNERPDWINGRPEACTTIMVGKKATFDGSVMTSHTDDSHRDRAWMDITPAKRHAADAQAVMTKRFKNDETAMPSYKFDPIGEIPQVLETFGYINTAYPCMNEKQLAAGETTFGGRDELQSDEGLIDCYQLVHLIMQRCTTVKEALNLTRELLSKYGWNDYGETLTLADKNEAWMLEIVGPGRGKMGAVWAAQRVPDGHISVAANASRIRHIDLDNPEYFQASENVFQVAKDSGWWNPEDGNFEFCYAYDPDGRQSISSRRREWRALSLAAPSLNLHPYSENYPFSVKPDTLITIHKMINIFQDYYEGTDYDMLKNLTVVNEEGETVISPLANPFMPYDMMKMLKINGGWGELGERTIARWYSMYCTITQSRDWLPDEIGGLVWFAWDNAATSIYVPMYCSVIDAPQSYKVKGRETGYTRESAWWAFNRLSVLTAKRWGDMRYDVNNVWQPMQQQMFDDQSNIEKIAIELLNKNREEARKYLTNYFINWGDKVVNEAWKLGDKLWTKYDEKF